MSTPHAITPRRSSEDSSRLASAYVWAVNQAIESDSPELASELADSYGRESQEAESSQAESQEEAQQSESRAESEIVQQRHPVRLRLVAASRRYLTDVVNPPAHLAPRARSRGPLSY